MLYLTCFGTYIYGGMGVFGLVGLVVALAVTRALATFVETLGSTTSTSISDLLLLLGAPTLLALVTLAASYEAARRSTSTPLWR
jgi:hypothetical protein